MKNNQKGATLIVVLILLLIITVIGTLAVKNSLTALNIATNSQAQQLLVQNSDSAIFHVENPAYLVRNLAQDGLFGFITIDMNKGKELVFCYKGTQSQFFNMANSSVMMWESGTAPSNSSAGLDGYCKLDSQGSFFTSGRKAVMTQVAVKVQKSTSNLSVGIENPFDYMQTGTDLDAAKIAKTDKVLVTSASIVPMLSTASDDAINDCFAKHINQVMKIPAAGTDRSVSQCLQDLGVPVNTQVTEYNLIQPVNRT